MPEHRILLADIDVPDIEGMHTYRDRGGYEAAARALRSRSPVEVAESVRASGLREAGGRWPAVASKWAALPAARDDSGGGTYLAVDVSDSEPGLFRDRKLAERLPHRLLEGVLIAAYAIGARVAYLCVRGESLRVDECLRVAAAEAYADGWLGADILGTGFDFDVHIHATAGGLIPGEESSLLAALESGPAEPRALPLPQPWQTLFGKPAIVHRACTLAYLPAVVSDPAAFLALGTRDYPGTILFCVSGHVRRPGLYEIEFGSASLRQLLEEYARGPYEGHQLKAVLTAYGAPVLTAAQLDIPLTPAAWKLPGGGGFPGAFGSGAVIAMDETTCMVEVAELLLGYYRARSCGQCAPCRAGAPWLLRSIERLRRGEGGVADTELTLSVAAQISPLLSSGRNAALCGFGESLAWAVQGLQRAFPDEFQHFADGGAVPAASSAEIRTPESVNVRF